MLGVAGDMNALSSRRKVRHPSPQRAARASVLFPFSNPPVALPLCELHIHIYLLLPPSIDFHTHLSTCQMQPDEVRPSIYAHESGLNNPVSSVIRFIGRIRVYPIKRTTSPYFTTK